MLLHPVQVLAKGVKLIAFHPKDDFSDLTQTIDDSLLRVVLNSHSEVVGRNCILVGFAAVLASVTRAIVDDLLLANWTG